MLWDLTLEFAVFAGAIISGFMGFAFSAVAGAILFHILPSIEAVPLMMVCSIIVQAMSLIYLRRTIEWQGSAMFILGGVVGVLPALYLLLHVGAAAFRVCFGIMLACYSAYMLCAHPVFIFSTFAARSATRLQDLLAGSSVD
jgi:uncharacterized membrane protein YfcA